MGTLWPYLTGRGVELCPSLNYALGQFKLKARGAAYGYGYNIHLSSAPGQPAFKISEVRSPALLAFLADAWQINTFQRKLSFDLLVIFLDEIVRYRTKVESRIAFVGRPYLVYFPGNAVERFISHSLRVGTAAPPE